MQRFAKKSGFVSRVDWWKTFSAKCEEMSTATTALDFRRRHLRHTLGLQFRDALLAAKRRWGNSEIGARALAKGASDVLPMFSQKK